MDPALCHILVSSLIVYPAVLDILTAEGYQLRRITCPYHCECDRQVWCANTSLRAIPSKLPPNTRLLDVSHNNITEIEAELWRLKSLESVDLSFNRISKISAGAFAMNAQLEVIQLQDNRLSSADFVPKDWGDLVKLRSLNLAYNKLGPVLSRGVFDGLAALRLLDLSHNRIISIPDGAFTGIQGLNQIILKSNLLLDVPITALKDVTGVQTLDISNNPIRQITADSFPCLTELDVLMVNSMWNLTSVNEDSFSCLVSLRCVEISDCPKLVHVSGTAFRGLSNLQVVDLSNNHLSHLNGDLLPWDRLGSHQVSLYDNPWCCDCSMKWLTDSRITPTINKPERVTCSVPGRFKGRPVTSLGEGEFQCSFDDVISHGPHYRNGGEALKHKSNSDLRSNYEKETFPKVFDVVVPLFVCLSLFILVLVGTYIKRVRTERKQWLLRSLTYGALQRDNYACTASNMDLPYDSLSESDDVRPT